MCGAIFPSQQELKAHSNSEHRAGTAVDFQHTAKSSIDTAPTGSTNELPQRIENNGTTSMADMRKSTDQEGNRNAKRRRIAHQIASYRDDSEFPTSSSNESTRPGAKKSNHKQSYSNNGPVWLQLPSDGASKARYKCRVCPKDFSTTSSCIRHFNTHPVCFRESKGHVVSEADRASGQERASCQECSKVLLLRRRTAAPKAGPSTPPSTNQSHCTADVEEIIASTGNASVEKKRSAEDTAEHPSSGIRPAKNVRVSLT